MKSGQELVLVANTASQMEAEILRAMLEANEVRVWLSREAAASAIGLGVGAMASVEIYVRADLAEKADSLLKEYYDSG